MTNLIDYVEALTEFGHPVAEHLRLGASHTAISDFERKLNLKLPPELKELYASYDGTEFREGILLGHRQFIPGFCLMSLEESAREKQTIDGIIEEFPFMAGVNHAFHDRDMLPFLADDLGNNVVMDVSPRSKHFGWIGLFWHADVSDADTYRSLQDLIDAHLAALRAGAYSISGEGYLEADFESLEAVLGKYRTK